MQGFTENMMTYITHMTPLAHEGLYSKLTTPYTDDSSGA